MERGGRLESADSRAALSERNSRRQAAGREDVSDEGSLLSVRVSGELYEGEQEAVVRVRRSD